MPPGNHVAYKRVKGRKTPAEEVRDLYEGLKDARLDHFDVLLSGYAPSAAVVTQIGQIARELKLRATLKPGAFFWVLDPVMGDNGHIYVAEDTVPVYRSLLKDADLILPNQFEAELLSEVKIHDLATMKLAIAKLHHTYRVPHVLITSIRLPPTASNTPTQADEDLASTAKLSVVGSTATSDMAPRLFRITVPALPVFFSGTGDMFASLMVARFRQAARDAGVLDKVHWRSPDHVPGADLPLARAAEKVLASMHAVLIKTAEHYDAESRKLQEGRGRELNTSVGDEAGEDKDMQSHLRLTRAAEVRVVRNARDLRVPPRLDDFQAQSLDTEPGPTAEDLAPGPDALGVVKVAGGEGAVHQT